MRGLAAPRVMTEKLDAGQVSVGSCYRKLLRGCCCRGAAVVNLLRVF